MSFDRKTFDPINNHADLSALRVLRAYGSGRNNRHEQSTAMQWALDVTETRNGLFVDLGCGESGDCRQASLLGFKAIGYDLFAPSITSLWVGGDAEKDRYFERADVVDHIPLDDASVDVAISQAMFDLVEPDARDQFFTEVNRVLKPGGVFSLYWQSLAAGWGRDAETEYDRVLRLWRPPSCYSNGFVAVKSLPVNTHSDACPPRCAHCHKCQDLMTTKNRWARCGDVHVCRYCCRIEIGQDGVGDYLRSARRPQHSGETK